MPYGNYPKLMKNKCTMTMNTAVGMNGAEPDMKYDPEQKAQESGPTYNAPGIFQGAAGHIGARSSFRNVK